MESAGGFSISFSLKVLFITIVIIFLSSYRPNEDDPQIISLCDTTYVFKKYTINPPEGYFSNWLIVPEAQIIGQPTDNTIVVKWNQIGKYTIIAQFSNGKCFSQNELEVIVEGCPETTLYIPNTFTPNGDGINDEFGAYGTNIETFEMEIYNRWGEIIFRSNGIEKRWDGYYKGNLSQDGIYVYKIYFKSKNLKSQQIIGRVALVNKQ